MPFNPQILDDLAAAGANISIDAVGTSPQILNAVIRLWDRGNGSVTIQNASRLPDAVLVSVARALGNRVTLVE